MDELTVALGFGLLIPVGAGLGFAPMATSLLLINQFRDLRADRKAGKRHWMARLGQARARSLYLAVAAGPTCRQALWSRPGVCLLPPCP